MLSVQSRKDLDKMTGKASAAAPAPPPAANPPAPAPAAVVAVVNPKPAPEVKPPRATPTLIATSPKVEQALIELASKAAAAMQMAAQAQESIAEMSKPKNLELEGNIVRDQQGKMTKVIITIRK